MRSHRVAIRSRSSKITILFLQISRFELLKPASHQEIMQGYVVIAFRSGVQSTTTLQVTERTWTNHLWIHTRLLSKTRGAIEKYKYMTCCQNSIIRNRPDVIEIESKSDTGREIWRTSELIATHMLITWRDIFTHTGVIILKLFRINKKKIKAKQ